MPTLTGMQKIRKIQACKYQLIYWKDFDFSIFENISARTKKDRSGITFNDIIVMADTETSKKYNPAYDDPVYSDIMEDLKTKVFLYKRSFKEIATITYLRSAGIKMSASGRSHIDVYHEELCERYPYIFSPQYNDIDRLSDILKYIESVNPVEDDKKCANHIVAWSIAFRAHQTNIACLYGQDPDEFPEMLEKVKEHLEGEELYIYFHNLPYDYCFLRKFLFKRFGVPEKQLNVKPLYPLTIQFSNGIIFRDSLMLAQRKLEKWASDLNVEHQKAVGSWDYNMLRNQSDDLSAEELLYIQNDVLSGVECIDETMKALDCNISSIPLTATGIPRKEARAIGRKNKAHDSFVRQSPPEYNIQAIFQEVFHGGYTHANRYYTDKVNTAKAKDFASSYPYCAIAFKYPAERFWKLQLEIDEDYVLRNMEEYAFLVHIQIEDLDLKDLRFPMPPLAHSKCQESLNAVVDNGKVLRADMIRSWMTDIDLKLILEVYKGKLKILEAYCSKKDFLPKWFTDYIYKCFTGKTLLKGVDKVQYNLEKAKLNSVAYGMIAQKPCKPNIIENYDTGEYSVENDFDVYKEYEKHLKNRNSFLPYHWCMYVTAYAQSNLFELGKCVSGIWLYSDTDSVYATSFDEEKVKSYNDAVIERLASRGYHPIEHKGRLYYLGVAEDDGDYSEFKALHSKCYCKRNRESGELSITVAGVPKKGVASLHNHIEEFHTGKIFPGKISGKLQHKYIYTDTIWVDEYGNKTGDSIDLSPCDYIIKPSNVTIIEDLENENVNIQVYEAEEIINEQKRILFN